MIELKNVTKVYGKNTLAVNDLSLDIKDGEIFGFLGPNGAGKSTTIKMITGITSPSKGEIYLNNKSIKLDALVAKREFGFVPDNPDVLLRLKGIEYLNFIASIYDVDKSVRDEKIKVLSEKFGMADALGSRIEDYSHGMRQKIIVIGVLLHDPNIWILDEPLTGLDPQSAFTLKEMMREHADKGKTVFFSTHVLEVAEKVCDRIGIINKGKLLFVGTIEELKAYLHADESEKSLEDLFLDLVKHE
ncbi:MAG: ABC transporter ATP-binding protein [Bacilli bacterium]|jgi:ABC-2 type transport system ATP-binding protein|nr:ABC transporter ATP-binding protein [Bacilli bacterium]MCH4202043.1 ABC transporter ATP-binding protein [Bacilli bacterium]MCH4235524.1 ABC transporter ATP-binding protein [Bacilli bacterium]